MDRAELRLGDGLSVLLPGEVQDIVIAGMGAETITQILEAAPWVFDERIRLVLVPATKHSLLRRWLCRNGFALKEDRLCRAAGRLYAVMMAEYRGWPFEPEGDFCILGLTEGQPGAEAYRLLQTGKLKKYRLGLAPGAQQRAVDELIARLERE